MLYAVLRLNCVQVGIYSRKPFRRLYGDDLGIGRPLPRRLLCLRVGVVGPAISRLVLKPYLRLAAGRREGDALWQDQESKLTIVQV